MSVPVGVRVGDYFEERRVETPFLLTGPPRLVEVYPGRHYTVLFLSPPSPTKIFI